MRQGGNMPRVKGPSVDQRTTDQQLGSLLEQALREAGVRDAVSVYEAAERAYTATVPAPKVWFTTSANSA